MRFVNDEWFFGFQWNFGYGCFGFDKVEKKVCLIKQPKRQAKTAYLFFIAELAMTNRSAGQSELAVANPISEAGQQWLTAQ